MSDSERLIITGNTIHLYNAKAPFVKSGKSISGALEYDKENETVKCHECGEWFYSLGRHSAAIHGLPRKEYKLKHGFPLTACLGSEGFRLARVAVCLKRRRALLKQLAKARVDSPGNRGMKLRRTDDYANRKGRCFKQLLKKIRKLGVTLGRAPSEKELKQRLGISRSTIVWKFGSVKEAMYLAGFEPNQRYRAINPYRGGCQLYDRESLIAYLKSFHKTHDRAPYASDMRRGLLPHRGTYLKYFGTWPAALKAAGITGSARAMAISRGRTRRVA